MSLSGASTAGQGAGINPNVPVGAEATSENRANSATTFDQVEEVMDAGKGKRGASRKPAERKDDDAGGDKDEANGKVEGEGGKPAAKKPAADKDEGEGADAGKDKGEKDGKDEPPAKPKVHKVRSGDKSVDLSGDSLVKVPVDGKHEDVPLQKLIDNYSGEVVYTRKFGELSAKEREHKEKVGRLNGVVEDLFKRANDDPNAALDWLAEMSGKDAVQMRGQMLRQQFEAMKDLYDMTESERETWFKDQERDARDRVHATREKARTDREAAAAHTAQVSQAKQHYGIDDDAFEKAEQLSLRWLKEQPGYKGEQPSVEQIVGTQRYMMVQDVVREHVPHLAKHEKFGDIVRDVVADAIKHPTLTREKLGKQLKDVFGEDNETLRRASRKAKAQADDGDRRQAHQSSTTKTQPMTFDDI